MNIKKNKKSFISIYKLKIFYFLKNKLTYLYKKEFKKFWHIFRNISITKTLKIEKIYFI